MTGGLSAGSIAKRQRLIKTPGQTTGSTTDVTIKDQLKAINTGIKEVSIEPRKDPPMPVDTLPAKVDGRKTHQQRIPTGYKADAQGLVLATVSPCWCPQPTLRAEMCLCGMRELLTRPADSDRSAPQIRTPHGHEWELTHG